MSLSNINPPVPQGVSNSNAGNESKSLGHRLIRLVRAAEKTQVTAEFSVLLDELSETFLRRGLLDGDEERAEKVLSSGTKSSGGNARRDKKGGNNNKNNNNNNKSLNLMNGDDDTEIESGAAVDETNLLLAALVRLAGGNQELSTPMKADIDCHLIIGGFNVCIAALQHNLARQRHERCAQAEYELVISVARGLLTGVCRTVKGILESSLSMDNEGTRNVVVSAFRTATLLLSLYGTKLSRNQPILTSLRSLAWEAIVTSDETLRSSCSNLLATLPLAGIDKEAPAALWTGGVIDGTAALYLLSEAVAPQTSKSLKALDPIKAKSHLSDSMKTNVSDWIERIQRTDSMDERLRLFNLFTSALSKYIVSLLQAEGLIGQESTVLSAARFPISEVLDLLETMLHFATFAEALYYGTKKRLRFEVIDDGLLSVHDIASKAANHVKGCGLDIFNTVLESIGRSVLLPFGRRIIKMAHSSLLTSCTVPLRHALDPSSSVRLDGKRKKWLHTSLTMRTKSIESFDAMICTMKSNALVVPSSVATGTRRGKSNQADKGVVLVVGCLLEQLSYGDIGNWGSLEERAATLVAAMNAISSTLTQGGGFLSFASRTLIDSAVKTCQENFQKKTTDNLCSSCDVKIAFLNLLSTCLVTPWPDGATTSQMHDFHLVAKHLSSDMNTQVSSTSRAFLQLMHSLKTPRSPPLVIVTRTTGSHDAPGQENASVIVDRLKVAQDSMRTSEAAAVEESAKKTSKRKKEKQDEREEASKLKRAKVDVVSPAVESKPKLENNPVLVNEDEMLDSTAGDTPTPTDDVEEPSAVEQDDDDDDMPDFPTIVDTGPDDEEE